MKTSKKILAAAIALPLFLGSFSAAADGHKAGEKKHHGVPHNMQPFFKGVELTTDQLKTLKEMKKERNQTRKSNKAQHQANKAAAKENREQMQKLLLAEKFDETAVRALAQKMAEAQVEHRLENLRYQHQVLSTLTAEQKKQVEANIADMASKKGKKDK